MTHNRHYDTARQLIDPAIDYVGHVRADTGWRWLGPWRAILLERRWGRAGAASGDRCAARLCSQRRDLRSDCRLRGHGRASTEVLALSRPDSDVHSTGVVRQRPVPMSLRHRLQRTTLEFDFHMINNTVSG